MIKEKFYQAGSEEDPHLQASKEFNDFIKKEGFTSAQIEKAYSRMLGIVEDESQDPAVEKIAAKMEEMSANKFPLSRFVEFVGFKRELENAVPNYYNFVDSLNISDKEKRVLISIVEKKRFGEIVCYVNNEIIAEFKIKKVDAPVENLAAELKMAISKILLLVPKDKKYAFSFSED